KSGPYFGAMQFPECFTATTTPEYVSPAAVETNTFLEPVSVQKYHHTNQSSSETTDYFMIQPHHHDGHSQFFNGENEEIKDPHDGEYNHDNSCTQYVGGNTV